MPVEIKNMTDAEFEIFSRWSIGHHAEELVAELRLSPEAALKEARGEFAGMLPDGLHTERHRLMTIAEKESGEAVGFIWTIHEEAPCGKQCFVCDFAVWEPKRRRGCGAEALRLAEEQAAEAGCRESVLFVADRNEAARALYEKSGYRFLRREGYGAYMVKPLA